MALVNPNIAMSFRQPEFRPRNALAEYAQVQQIMGGQRQAEMADMQMDVLRRKERAISQIQATAAKNGGPTDRREIARAYINSGVPEFMQFGLTMDKDLDELDAFSRIMGGGAGGAARAAPSVAAAAAGAAAPGATPTFPIAGKDVRMGTLGTGTFDSARSGDIGLVQPGLSRMSAADKAEIAASAGPGGIQSMRLSQGPYMGTESMIADILRAPPEEQAAIERALPSMKIPGVSAGRVPPFSQLSRDLLSPETRNALSYGYAPASLTAPAESVNALAPPSAGVNQLASAGAAPAGAAPAGTAPADPVAALLAKRDQLLALGTPRALQAAKSLDADIARVSKTTAVTPGSTVIGPDGRVIYTAPAAPTAPRIEVIGVAKGTETPVYFDKDTRAQFTIGTDPSGKQIQVPYTGGVNRATSSVTATATSMGGRLEGAEQKGKGEFNIKEYGEIATAARLAAKTLPALETQSKILDQGFTTGFGTDVKTAGASVLASLGVKNAEKFATNSQTFLAATQQAVLQKQLEQKGTQTAADAERITQTAAQRGNTVDANRFLIDVAKAQLKRDIEQREFYDNWWADKKTYEGVERAWYAGEGGKSLFDRPELKKYLTPSAAEVDKRTQRLENIFNPQQQRRQ